MTQETPTPPKPAQPETQPPPHIPDGHTADPPPAPVKGAEDAEKAPDHLRVAGRKEMDMPPRRWDIVDEQGDESFPASDPPGNY